MKFEAFNCNVIKGSLARSGVDKIPSPDNVNSLRDVGRYNRYTMTICDF